MNRTLRVIGKTLFLILIISDLAFIAPAAIGLIGASQDKGTRLGLALADQSSGVASGEEIKQIIKLLGARIEKLGISNAVIEPSKADGEVIQVLLPPKTNVEEAKRLLTYVGLLELRLVAKGTQVPYERRDEAEQVRSNLKGRPDDYKVVRYRSRESIAGLPAEGWIIIEKSPVITGADMQNVQAGKDQYSSPNYYIDFQLTPTASKRFARVTADNIGSHLAIVLNNEARSFPIIQSQINDRGQISGGYTRQTAEDLAIILSTGALPRPLRVVSEQIVDARK
jgi:preprotein translocase subunit SecD